MTLYADLVDLAALPPVCRDLHHSYGRFEGRISVTHPTALVLRTLARLTGFPPPMQNAPLVFLTQRDGPRDIWIRRMGSSEMSSRLWVEQGMLAERLGVVTVLARLQTEHDGLSLIPTRFRLLGVPIPARLMPVIKAREFSSERDGQTRYCFEVSLSLGRWKLITYEGWLSVDPGK